MTEIESSEGGWGGVTLSAHSLLAKEMPVCSVLTMTYRSASGFGFLPLPRMALGCLSLPPSLPPSLPFLSPSTATSYTDGDLVAPSKERI